MTAQTYKRLLIPIMVMLMVFTLFPMSAFAAQDTVTLKKDLTLKSDGTADTTGLPKNFVSIAKLGFKKATFSTTNDAFQDVSNFSYVSGGDQVSQMRAICYVGKINYGTANTTKTADAKTARTEVDGSFTLTYSNAAELPDKTKADIILTVSNVNIYAGAKDSSVKASTPIYLQLIAGNGSKTRYIGTVPRTGKGNKTSLETTTAVRMDTTVKVVEHGTTTPIDATKYPLMLTGFRDLDVTDHLVKRESTTKNDGTYAEGIAFLSNFNSPIHVTKTTMLELVETSAGYQKVKNKTENTDSTMNTGFIASVTPQGYKYRWYGSGAASYAVASKEDGLVPGRHMVTAINTYADLTGGKPDPEWTVDYEWEGDAPDIDTPDSTENIPDGTEYTVDTTFTEGKTVTDDNGTWTFQGWDKTGTFTVKEDTTIHGTWKYTGKVNVQYKWKGEYPESEELPEGATVDQGSEYTVDTTYKDGDTAEDETGIWTFQGWDKTGTITIDEDTIIYGEWEYADFVNVSYEWDGDSPEGKDVPTGKDKIVPGSTYSVDTTYSEGDIVKDSEGIWTFQGWDKEGDITINEDTVIKGKWTLTPYVSVTYEWDGDSPEGVTVPDGETGIEPGTEYDVDTSYTEGKEVADDNGIWTFHGWDKTGTITIDEDTVIKGKWSFANYLNITTEVVNGTITDDITDIPPGENRTVTYSPNENCQIVSVTVDGTEVDPEDYPASYAFNEIVEDHDIKVVYELIPAIEIEKDADGDVYNAGDTVTYTVTVKQTVEGAEARNVVIKDTLPEGLTLNKDSISGEGITVASTTDDSYELTVDSLTDELTYTYTAVTAEDTDAETLVNTVEATAENVPDSATDTATVKSLTPKPVIDKSVSNSTPQYGDEIIYTISVKEPQDGVSVRNAVITDSLPDGIVYVEDSLTTAGDKATCEVENGTITVNIPTLESETVVQFHAIVTKLNGTVKNIAVLSEDNIKDIEDDEDITVEDPDPTIAKTVSKEKVTAGEKVKYTIKVSSDIPVINAIVEDTVPEGVEIDEESITCSREETEITIDGNTMTISLGTLSDEVVITYKAKVTKAGEYTNTAALSGDNFPDGPLEATATVTAKKKPAPPAKVTKEDTPSNPQTGQTIPWYLVAAIIAMLAAAGYLTARKLHSKR